MREAEEEAPATTANSTVASTTETTIEAESEDNNEVGSDENLEQCFKCRKAAYAYKKEFLCQRCLQAGLVKPGDKIVNCDKCRKPKYRARNGGFCEAECNDIQVNTKTTTATEATTTTAVPEVEIGVLGHIFRYLVATNTWGMPPMRNNPYNH